MTRMLRGVASGLERQLGVKVMKWSDFFKSIAAVALVAGCSTRMPLDAVVAPTVIKGQIAVTVLNGISPTALVNVQIIGPNGSSQTEMSSSSVTTLGQAIFSEPMAGRYSVSIANQPSQAPNSVPVTLTTAQPYASVNLQIGYGYLSVTAADGKGFCYDETQAYHSYTVTYVNPTNLQQDATVLYNAQASTLPPGWSVIFNSTVLKAGQNTHMLVQTAPWTVFGNVTIVVSAVSNNSTPIFAAPVVLMQKWQPEINVVYLTAGCSDFWLYLEYLCENCSTSGNSVMEQFTDSRPAAAFDAGCSVSDTLTLTDVLTTGGQQEPVANNSCLTISNVAANTISFSTTFPNNKTYNFSNTGNCSNWNETVTITASMAGD